MMTNKRWWVLAEQFFPVRNYNRYDDLVIHRLCFKRSQWSDTGLYKNKFVLKFEQFGVWKRRLFRDDNFARTMWPRHLKHQRLINDWLTIS